MASISASLASLNSALDIATGLFKLKLGANVEAKIRELNGVILAAQRKALAAQSAQGALLKRVGDLEAEIARLEAWEAEKQKYELAELRPGLLAYARKPDAKPAELPHFICANCYEERRKSILQTETRFPGRREFFVCNRCRAELRVVREAPHPQPPNRGRR